MKKAPSSSDGQGGVAITKANWVFKCYAIRLY